MSAEPVDGIGARVRLRVAGREIEGLVTRHVNRNGVARSEREALYTVLTLDSGETRQVRRRGMQRIADPPRPDPPAPAPAPEVCTMAEPAPPPQCAPKRPAWKSDRKHGAIYMAQEAGGAWAVALVLMDPDGGARQAASIRGLAADDLEDQAVTLARRLVREALRAGSKEP